MNRFQRIDRHVRLINTPPKKNEKTDPKYVKSSHCKQTQKVKIDKKMKIIDE